MSNAEKILAAVGALALVLGLGLLLAFPIKWCWNYTIPYIFGLKTITWTHALCLYLLAKALIKASQTNNNK